MNWLKGLKALGQDCLTVLGRAFRAIGRWLCNHKTAVFFTLSIIYYELMLQLMTFGSIDIYFAYPLLFAIPFGCLCGLIATAFNRVVNTVISTILLVIFSFYFNFQVIYYSLFNDFFTFALADTADDAMGTFGDEIIYLIVTNLLNIFIICIPFIIFIVSLALYRIAAKPERLKKMAEKGTFLRFLAKTSNRARNHFDLIRRRPLKSQLVLSLVAVVAYGITILTLFFPGTGYHTPYDLYFNSGALSTQISKLGLITSTMQDLGVRPTPEEGDDVITLDPIKPPVNVNPPQPDNNEDEPDPDQPDVEPEKPIEYNILQIDFDALMASETDKTVQSLHTYFSAVEPTKKNDKTGMFKGYNLIYICAESFSSAAIVEPELTPNLYKMATEGFIFNNYYTMFPSNTTNGEYAFCTGLIPDLTRQKSNGSFLASKKNYLPFCLGNMFGDIGIQARAYHNHTKTYYSRNITHPNIGYIFKARNQGIRVTGWPESDYEMAKQSYEDFINDEQFHAYYMTVSGHYRYTFELKEDSDGDLVPLNTMAVKNKAQALKYTHNKNGEKYDTTCQAYLACHIELDKMIGELVDKLTAAGKMDNTVFVLGADHYPYGLSAKEYNNIMSEEIDTAFEKFRSTLILYNSQMINTMTLEERTVDKTCCAVDVLPTVLNLFGFDYDSRLLSGSDIFSDTPGLAILADQSYVTDYVKYNASSRKITYLVDEFLVPEGYVDSYIEFVKNKCTAATAILNKDYFAKLFPEAAIAHREEVNNKK